MSRRPRQKSRTGIYHIMLRGCNRQSIFIDDQDNYKFLETLVRYKALHGFEVYGWCLMGNHVHLLMKEGNEELSRTFRCIGTCYAGYYNLKYQHTGHVFQDRYRSEAINDENYLLTVVRYIHRNPIEAAIVERCEEWKWSSFTSYFKAKKQYPKGLLDRGIIMDMFSKDEVKALEKFKLFNEEKSDDKCMDDKIRKRLTDEEAFESIKQTVLPYTIQEIKSLTPSERNKVVKKVKQIEGLTQRQIARILGISQALVSVA